MEETRPQPQESFARRHQHSVESIVTLLEWLLVAFILALMFQGFGVQAFQIPTGSMAETLRGAHYKMRCQQCGYMFNVGSDGGSLGKPQCPNCDYFQPPDTFGDLKNGDRIFVLKCIYQFFQPKRWDVVVFKNPINPRDNYIKRLIGLPGETVELINGDVYINGQITRKPINVQKELWMPIFLQDHQPFSCGGYFREGVDEHENTPNRPWILPFVNEPTSEWTVSPEEFRLESDLGHEHTLSYHSENPNDFRATYAYNDSSDYSVRPVVSDLMITFYANCSDSGQIAASLEKYNVLYTAKINLEGSVVFSKTVDGHTTKLREILTGKLNHSPYERFEFANVDRLLILKWAGRRFEYNISRDASFTPQEAVYEKPPRVQIHGSGHLSLRHISLFRDIFYIGKEAFALRATEEKPFTLQDDQFFVCGDNSNNSLDGRLWSVEGIGNNGIRYREGVVPRDYMMGKAVMIYWSQAFTPMKDLPPMIPNFNNLKVIYGGSEQDY